ncbi:hypothetical protein TYRP_004568 [Tyrophagus putrescentiae]|nr:hypothetical protein TYRP_004568 [Tyrophagus putrescentiae]
MALVKENFDCSLLFNFYSPHNITPADAVEAANNPVLKTWQLSSFASGNGDGGGARLGAVGKDTRETTSSGREGRGIAQCAVLPLTTTDHHYRHRNWAPVDATLYLSSLWIVLFAFSVFSLRLSVSSADSYSASAVAALLRFSVPSLSFSFIHWLLFTSHFHFF